MYTVDELRAIIKEELDKKEYIQEPYSLFEPILYILEDGETLAASFNVNGLQSLPRRY